MPDHDSPKPGPALGDRLRELYRRLYDAYGPQGWWPGDGPTDVVIGAILTQSASWKNVELALANLKANNCSSLAAIHCTRQDQLAQIIRPSGYYNAKARKLKAFAAYIAEHHGGNLQTGSQEAGSAEDRILVDGSLEAESVEDRGLEDGSLEAFLAQETAPLRAQLLSIHGIGPETADDIILYAANKPSFVIDAYTRRILHRLGLATESPRQDYASLQALFHDNLPPDVETFQEFHALLDRHAKDTCAKTPRCPACPLLDICPTGRSWERTSPP